LLYNFELIVISVFSYFIIGFSSSQNPERLAEIERMISHVHSSLSIPKKPDPPTSTDLSNNEDGATDAEVTDYVDAGFVDEDMRNDEVDDFVVEPFSADAIDDVVLDNEVDDLVIEPCLNDEVDDVVPNNEVAVLVVKPCSNNAVDDVVPNDEVDVLVVESCSSNAVDDVMPNNVVVDLFVESYSNDDAVSNNVADDLLVKASSKEAVDVKIVDFHFDSSSNVVEVDDVVVDSSVNDNNCSSESIKTTFQSIVAAKTSDVALYDTRKKKAAKETKPTIRKKKMFANQKFKTKARGSKSTINETNNQEQEQEEEGWQFTTTDKAANVDSPEDFPLLLANDDENPWTFQNVEEQEKVNTGTGKYQCIGKKRSLECELL
jgi:hypothetical protein